jgi:Integrase core domain
MIILVVDRLSRMVWTKATKKISTSNDIFTFIVDLINIYSNIPTRILTDRGTQFTNNAWYEALRELGVTRSMCSVRYPEGNGLAERHNQNLLQKIRLLVDGDEGHWYQFLHIATSAMNNNISTATGLIPKDFHESVITADYVNLTRMEKKAKKSLILYQDKMS